MFLSAVSFASLDRSSGDIHLSVHPANTRKRVRAACTKQRARGVCFPPPPPSRLRCLMSSSAEYRKPLCAELVSVLVCYRLVPRERCGARLRDVKRALS